MPIGNLTSQFFANVYLNELDQFVKHKLKAKYYLRYVDDFVLLHRDKCVLQEWKATICEFLDSQLELELHPDKTNIVALEGGISMLGYRVFYNHRLLKKSNASRIWKRLKRMKRLYDKGLMTRDQARKSLDGWLAYAKFADTYNQRKRVELAFNLMFP
jgi:hypothetical protein